MIFGHKKLSESVVMREFEKVAIAKKMVKVSEEPVITKEASASYQPSNNLIDDMLKLATGLRDRGFEKDASSLEEKVLTYKLAETHLYRAIDEDAEDMLEFAHPKKDKIVFDAANGDGEVEDTLSQHKKIIDIVNKQPKKVAFDVLAETADILGLKKKADKFADIAKLVGTSDIAALISNINFLKAQLVKVIPKQGALYVATNNNNYVLAIGTGSVLWTLVEGIRGNYYTPHTSKDFEINFLEFYRRANSIQGVQWDYSLENADADFRTLFATKDYVDHANVNLQHLYSEFNDKINGLPEINEKSDVASINKFVETVNSLIGKDSWFVLKGLTNNDGELENKIRLVFINQISENAQALAQELTAKQPAVATGMDKVLDPGFANIIAGRFESVSGKDNHSDYFKNIASVIRANGGKPYKELYTQLVQIDKDLASATDESKLDLVGQDWQKGYKVAYQSNNLIKEALTLGEVFKTPSRTPATAPYNRPAGRNAGRSAVKETSTFEKAFPEEFNAVATMQNSLQLLADNLDKFGVNKDKQTQIRNILLGTGGVQGTFNGRVDGIWGGKTEAALKEANVILASHGIKEKLSTDAQRINGELQEGHESKDVANLATANVNVFNQALDSVGVSVKKPEDDNSPYLDSLPENPNLLQTEPPIDENKASGLNLTDTDLGSFAGLYQFIGVNRLLDISAGGFNYQSWENILHWFYIRANKQAALLKTKAKIKYFVLTQGLYKKLLAFENKDPSKILSARDLDGVSRATGPTQNAAYKINPNADGSEVKTDVNNTEVPPFGYKFNIDALYDNGKYRSYMKNYDKYRIYLSIPILEVNDFSYSIPQITHKYIKALSDTDVLSLNGENPAAQVRGVVNPLTYLQLMNSNHPTAINFRRKADDLALMTVVNGLSRDLPEILNAYIKTSPSEKYNDIIMNAWDKWSANLSSTMSRINSDFHDAGPAPKVIF